MTEQVRAAAGTTRVVRPALVLLGLLALAANLRAALTGYPPLLETVRGELGISAGAAGLVQASSILMMAVGSFVGPVAGERLGRERGLGVSVALVAGGSLLRGIPVLPSLIGGSLVVGLGIGLAGVLLTGVVKERLADRAGVVTGGYVVSMMVGATATSALAVPVAVGLGGWSLSLAIWAVPAAIAAGLWWPLARRLHRERPADRAAGVTRLPWRNPFARLAATYMAMSSLQFYGWLTWLPPYYESLGWTPTRAGLLLAVWSLAQIPAALLVPMIAERRRRWTFWALLATSVGGVGSLGALLAPTPALLGPWFWAMCMAIGVGAGFPMGIAVIAWRTPDGAASAAASGLALGVGYVTAGLGPLLMGLLIDATGGYPIPLSLLVLAAVVQLAAIAAIGRRPGTYAPSCGCAASRSG